MNFLLSHFRGVEAIKRILSAGLIVFIVLAPFILLYLNMSQLREDNKRLNSTIVELKAENSTLRFNVDTLKGNMDALQKVNAGNIDTIRKLSQERNESKRVIESLSQSALNDSLAISMMSDRIKEMLKDPQNDGDVSPILRETIKNIQDNRKK